MGDARAMFDAAKHPRGFHGHFGGGGRGYSIRNVGKKGVARVDQPFVVKGGKKSFGSGGSRYTRAGASTLVYSKVPGRRIRKVDYRFAVHRTPSGGFISGSGVFVNLGNGLQGRGLRGWGGQVGVKGHTHLGIRPKRKGG